MPDYLHDPDLDRLIAELNRGAVPADPSASHPGTEAAARLDSPRHGQVDHGDPLAALLAEVTRRAASDLLLVPGCPPVLRIDGRLLATDRPALDGEELRALFAPYLAARTQRKLADEGAADFSLRLAGLTPAVPPPDEAAEEPADAWLFRVNLHRQRGRLAASVRALPREIPSLAGLGLPASLAELVQATRGLVLICGPTGSGKSTTLAALVGEINRTQTRHVITIEDPIEYLHSSRRSIVEQVEVGIDTPSFAAALRAALRQDPDVILVGEMRDLETVATALTAAETGHLILSTLHTSDVVQTVHRIVDVFPPAQQGQIRQQLALSLDAVVHQQLLPRADGGGRVPAVEVLRASYAVRHHVRRENLQKLYNEMVLGRRHGMITLEQSLAELVAGGAIRLEEARLRSPRPEELESLLRS